MSPVGVAWEELRRRVGARLEAPSAESVRLGRRGAAGYARRARIARPFDLPASTAVVGVAGSTLGGSGVTPLVGALALALRARGCRVAVLSHGYGTRRSRPRRVRRGDAPHDVGDEAVELEQWLRGAGVGVYTGRPRTTALALAAANADVVILDGVLASARGPLTASLLVLDAERPWGAGYCPPVGNLRAGPDALLRAATDVVWLGSPGGGKMPVDVVVESSGRPVHPMPSSLVVTRSGREVPLGEVAAGRRLGVVLGVGRPERVFQGLARACVRPVRTVVLADHAPAWAFQRRERGVGAAEVDLWLTTSKCATKLGDSFAGAPLLVMRRSVEVPSGLVDALLGRVVAAVGGRACLSAEERAMVPPCSGTA